MPTNNQFIWAVHVEGLGLESSKLGGALFYYGRHAVPVGSYTWIPALLDLPPSIDQQADITTGNVRGASFNFNIRLDALTRPLLGRRGIVSVGELAADVNDVASFVALPPGLENTIVFIGDETILLTSATTSGGHSGYVAFRGFFQSATTAHGAGTAAYVAPESMKDRKITLYRYRLSNGSISARWQGYLNDAVSPDPGVVTLQCVAELDAQARTVKNRNPTAFDGTFDHHDIGVWGGGFGPSSIFAPGSTHEHTAVSVGGGVCEAKWRTANGGSVSITAYDVGYLDHVTNNRIFPMRLGSSCETVDEKERYQKPITEALVIDRIGDKSGRQVSFTQALASPYHPLVACLAILVSDNTWAPASFKVLSGNVGLGLVTVDVSQWIAEIAATPELDQAVDQFVECFDGASFRPLETIRKLLKIYGYFLIQASDGRARVQRVTTLTISGVAAAFDFGVPPMADGPLERKEYLRRTTSKVFANVGALPWDPGVSVPVLSVTDSKRAAMFDDGSLDFDVRTKRKGSAPSIAYQAASLAGLLFHSLPRARVRVPSALVTGTECELLSEVALIDVPILSAWWIDKDGAALTGPEMAGLVDFVGLVESRKELVDTGALELELYLVGYRGGGFARERAPSLHVTAVVANWLYCAPASAFGDISFDCDRFAYGDEVSLRYVDGAPASAGEVRTVIAVVNSPGGGPENYVVLSSAFTTATPGAMFLRLAESELYSNTSRYSFTDRPYCYLCTDTDQISDSTSTLRDGDPFGGALGIS